MPSEKCTKAVDLSHHLSDHVRRYAPSPLKDLQKYFDKDIITFAGGKWSFCFTEVRIVILLAGMPSPEYFPFTSISADVLPADAFSLAILSPAATSSSSFVCPRDIFGASTDCKDYATVARVEVPRTPLPDDGGVNLATALQYGPATGLARTRAFIREFTERVYAPAYDDWTTLVHTGNTDGYAVLVDVAFGG